MTFRFGHPQDISVGTFIKWPSRSTKHFLQGDVALNNNFSVYKCSNYEPEYVTLSGIRLIFVLLLENERFSAMVFVKKIYSSAFEYDRVVDLYEKNFSASV